MNNKLKIVCWKWENVVEEFRNREVYTAEHVNKFARMVSRNLSIPHEIVCITDSPEGIDSSVRIVPIWDDFKYYGMCYRRLRVFSEKMKDIIGPRFVSMDLDCVIVKDITSLFVHNADFKIWHSENKGAPYCGSMFMMDAGARKSIWENFKMDDLIWLEGVGGWGGIKSKRWAHKTAYDAGFTIGSDQAWISYNLYPKEHTWGKADGVFNFKKDLYKKYRSQYHVLKKAKIIFFPGEHDPSHKELYKEHPWIPELYK